MAGDAGWFQVFFPQMADLVVDAVADQGGDVLVTAHSRGGPVSCWGCGTPSSWVHGYYRRVLRDVPVAGRPVVIALRVRRLACCNPACRVRTFAEPLSALTEPYARRTALLRRFLEVMALALAGRAAARLLEVVGVRVGRDTLIGLIRALPDPEIGQINVPGVDDFARRRGQSYATLIIDMDTHKPVDVLEDREADTLANWLRAHPGVQVVCRDRAGAYAAGAADGAPDAIQCADRWHLWDNLREYVEKTVAAHLRCVKEHYDVLQQAADEQVPDPRHTAEQASADNNEGRARVVRARERYAQVQALKAEGRATRRSGGNCAWRP